MKTAPITSSAKREADLQIISEWIEPGSRVMDLGCGRGVFLEQLRTRRNVQGLGVDIDEEKIAACVKRGVPAYQGDAEKLLTIFDEGHFDWVVLSRTVQELENPAAVLKEALRAGRNLAVGFSNHGYWQNRMRSLLTGRAVRNESDTGTWPEQRPHNPVSVAEFEAYCRSNNLKILHRKYLADDWKTPIHFLPSLRAAYALYAVSREQDK